MRSHGSLAFVHVVDPDQPGQAMVRDFALDEMFRHHTDHFTAFGETGVGQPAHQSVTGAAIDQAPAASGDRRAECVRRFGETGIFAFTRAQINTDLHAIAPGKRMMKERTENSL